MKNNRGKGHVFFIIVIPLVLILGAIVADTVISYSVNKNFRKITESILNDMINAKELTVDDYEDFIRRAYERNDYETENLVVIINSNEIYVENEHQYSGIFTSLFYKNKNTVEKVLLGVTVRVSENSKAFIKCKATFDETGKLVFEYIK